MKRILPACCLLLTFLLAIPLRGADRIRERVYLSTDREVYVAGDAVWLSAWCVDASTGQPSSFSKIAYVEVHSAAGMAQTAKIALEGGRGAGRLILPNTLPTGNYRLLAYTRLGASETGFDPLIGARTISVFNTFSTDRTRDGVEIVPQVSRGAGIPAAGPLSLTAADAAAEGSARISLTNNGTDPVSISLSVRHDDGIPAPAGRRIGDFVRDLHALPAAAGFDDSVIPEYEGEIIRVRVSGTDQAGRRDVAKKFAFISTPGTGEDLYTESLSEDGTASLFTSNVFGDLDMFLEIEDLDEDEICHLEVVSPFRDFPAGDIPALAMSREWAGALELRGLGMQLEKFFDADTLYSGLPARRHRVFDDHDRIRYILDDYTRFPLMEEVFIEFIPEIRARRVDGRRELQVWMPDELGSYYFPSGKPLVMLDGIPVLDHEKIFAYDPLLVKYIDIYTDFYYFGKRVFTGVVNFVTYKGTLPSLQFEDNVRIIAFQGCSVPLAYTCEDVDGQYPDYRQTLYWHPLLTLGPGESVSVPCKTPAYSGRFEVVAEGLTGTGEAVSASTVFNVR
jgi:hypothetical protein